MINVDMPVIELPRQGRITVRTPPMDDARRWFFDHLGWRTDVGPDPDDLGGVSLPRTHLDKVIGILLTRWEAVELFREYRPEMRCTHRCRYATKLICACACSGEQHGSESAEVPLLRPDGDFEMIGSGYDNWSLVKITKGR